MQDPDPGLSARGQAQARATAEDLVLMDSMTIFSSPMVRAKETAAPLATIWSADIIVEPALTEIPSAGVPSDQRGDWLRALMRSEWANTDKAVRDWRDALLQFLTTRENDCIAFSHFVAINAAVGAAAGHDRVLDFRPDNASVTIMEATKNGLRLVARGREMQTHVN